MPADSLSAEWFVYIVECADNSLYTGITNDLPRRLEMHNQGKGARYTRGRGPVTLRYQESLVDKGKALQREHQLKQLSRAQKIRLINSADQ